MRKYLPNESCCGAVYDNAPADNPFLAALPEMLPRNEFLSATRSTPGLPHDLPQMSSEERRQSLPLLASLFVPLDYMYAVYDQLYRAIRETYTTRTTMEEIRQINSLFCGKENVSYATQAASGSILGVPGIGKTSTIRRALETMPQVIEHTEYMGQPFYCKQVLYLRIECPSDCSVKTLALNLLSALDRAIGSDYLHQLISLRSIAASAVATQVKILCMTHHVGLLLVDEIQNAVETAQRNRQIKPLLKFLVELTNDTATAVYFVGTPVAEQLFVSQEHLKRRTRGIRLLPLKPDGTYRRFLEQLWLYQFTPQQAPLTEKLSNKLFDHSGGIPAYIIKIFQECQAQVLLMGQARIDERVMQRAIDILAIKVPKTYSGGTYLSDFDVEDTESSDAPPARPPEKAPGDIPEESSEPVPRLYANQRGRRAAARDVLDLVATFSAGVDLLQFLRDRDLLEGWSAIC